eukprot:CAMPEP_0181099222 /NCGR_PEP_ID=MMETSP1071-20121207/12545_1 /TAXON_ID=35127 /ORGANISM="Thalassiosira sp., Strain NH16" /LENGTH=188 /DNA_ID=CAMNT_0023181871 /DNA_START=198 /DNA_END=764 /DNA_ORIENTATION=+
MFLSPSAEPFQPLEFAIFNNGVPSSVFYGCHPEHEVVQHIPDEAIEELFPPSAEEVAEMEAAEDFVETMAWLSFLDECDEAARSSFSGYGKRWAARRRAGLVGKPHPPRASRRRGGDDGSDDGIVGRARSGTVASAGETSLVPYAPRIFEARPRKVEGRMFGVGCVPKHSKGMRGHMGVPIHQPRKHY